MHAAPNSSAHENNTLVVAQSESLLLDESSGARRTMLPRVDGGSVTGTVSGLFGAAASFCCCC